ncbi:VIT1/CCC1 transporter family protein [bacterium]|nr:VIT1/CCC1 transporter family protein [bacterium]
MNIPQEYKRQLLSFQVNELTERFIYRKLAEIDKTNSELFLKLSEDELRHYRIWRRYTEEDVAVDKWKLFKVIFLAKLFGVTFATKLMERGENRAKWVYQGMAPFIPEASTIQEEEEEHEAELLKSIDEEKLKYIDSMVLGLNDALVELLGTLAGLALALRQTKIIGLAGSVTGIAAALSMMSSEYLSKKTEKTTNPLRASIYTGIAYFITLLFLVFPFFIFQSWHISLMVSLADSMLLLFLFTFFLSVVEEVSLKHRFREMLVISLGVAGLSFLLGYLLKLVFNVEV